MAGFSLVLAAVLTIAIGIGHSWLGEAKIIGPLLTPEMRAGPMKSTFLRQIIRLAWHLTTLAWFGLAALMLFLAPAPQTLDGRLALVIVSVTFALTGLVTLVGTRGRHLAWIAFFAIAALTIYPVLI